MGIEEYILNYFKTLDESLDALSLHNEGDITNLPSWVHTTRKIVVGITSDGEGIALKVTPDVTLATDEITVKTITDKADINNIISMSFEGFSLQRLDFMLIGDMVVSGSNPLSMPALHDRSLVGFGKSQGFFEVFDINKAKQEAIDLWNKRNLSNPNKQVSYVVEVRSILSRMQAIIKRKAFLERRIHRFINEHKKVLLPNYRNCLFEHILQRNGEKRKADFILEREQGLPPMLIELESPVHKVFTARLDLSAEANHARQQISEWVSFIDTEPQSNAQGDLSFLSGPKERLIIIGRGLENRSKLIETKFDGTVIWTYDLFIEEAKRRLNDSYAGQCQMLNMPVNKLFSGENGTQSFN